MRARRTLTILAVVALMTAAVVAVAPERGERTPSRPLTAPPGTTPTPSGARGREISAVLDAAEARRPRVVEATVGDLLDLTVRVQEADSVVLDDFDRIEPVDPSSPARIELLLDRPGRFDVRLQRIDRVVGRLEVSPAE